jgi:hypothetical protein
MNEAERQLIARRVTELLQKFSRVQRTLHFIYNRVVPSRITK